MIAPTLRLLGVAIEYPAFLAELVGALGTERVDVFDHADERVLYRVLAARLTSGQETRDVCSLADDFTRLGGLDLAVISGAVAEGVSTVGAHEQLAGALERWRRKRAKRILDRYATALGDPMVAAEIGTETVDDVFARVESELVELTSGEARGSRVASDFLERAAYYDDVREGRRVSGWGWGIAPLSAWSLVEPGALTVLAGLSKHGKTHVATHLLAGHSSRNLPCLHLTLESGRDRTWDCYVAWQYGVDSRTVGHPSMDGGLIERLRQPEASIYSWPLSIEDVAGCSTRDIVARIREWRLRRRVERGIVVVDFIQQIADERGRHENGAERLTRIAYDLAALAVRERDIAIVALAQLNREAERDGSSTARHIEGSGGIQQAARSIVVLDSIYMRQIHERAADPSVARPDCKRAVIAANVVNRGTESGSCTFTCNLATGRCW